MPQWVPSGNTAIPLFSSVCTLSLFSRQPVPVLRLHSALYSLSERDLRRPTNDVGCENAREERGLPGLDDQPIYQKFPSSTPVQPSVGTKDDLPGPHYQVRKAEGPYQILEHCSWRPGPNSWGRKQDHLRGSERQQAQQPGPVKGPFVRESK